MWVHLNSAFLSIVDPKASYAGGKGPKSGTLLVRARFKGDIQRVFPNAAVTETPERDYRFRAYISRIAVAEAMHAAVMEGIDYLNFKGSTPEKFRHDAYAKCHAAMDLAQEQQARGGGRGQKDIPSLLSDSPYAPTRFRRS